MTERRVTVIGLGGTIAMSGGDGVVPALSAAQLIDAVPGLTGAGLAVEDLRRVPGASVSFDALTELAGTIRARIDGAAEGLVIIQGTDTIEESAYLLDLVHDSPVPLVVTGAMRNPTLAGADGPANLLAAVQVARDPGAGDLGCLVVLADEIHAARRVRKTHATSGAAFQSPDGGPLGYVVEGRPRLLNRVERMTVRAPRVRPARVGLMTVVLGDDGTALDIAERVDGLVVAAFGAGHVPEWLVDPLTELTARMPVVLASRASGGSTLTRTYGFAGSERDLTERGLIPAGFLDPLKSRILLHTLLTRAVDRTRIRAAFAAAGGNDPASWPWR